MDIQTKVTRTFQVLLIILLLLWLIFQLVLVNFYTTTVERYQAQALTQIEQRAASLAITQRELVAAKMQELDRILLTMRDMIRNSGFSSPQIRDMMLTRKGFSDEVADFLLLDQDGEILAWTQRGPAPDVSDRDYYLWHKNKEDDHPYLSQPSMSRVEESRHFIALSRPVRSDDGRFAGVLVAAIDIERLARSLGELAYLGEMTTVLARDDGTIVLRLPYIEQPVGQTLASIVAYGEQLPQRDTFIVVSPFDGQSRQVAFERTPHWPLVVFVGEELAPVYANIDDFTAREQQRWLMVSGLVTLFMLIIAWLLWRRHGIEKDLKAGQRALAELNQRNLAIVEAMPDLLFTLDAHGKFIDYQAGEETRLLLPPEQFLGKKLSEVMPSQVADKAMVRIARVIQTGSVQQLEYDLEMKGEQHYFELRMSHLADDKVLAIARDITTRKKAEAQLTWQATHDSLTGLPNRVLFYDRLNSTLSDSRRYHHRFALLYIDIDGFKPVNDSQGHAAGDQLLIELARRLQQCVRSSDTVARLAGDEFAIIIRHCEGQEVATKMADKVLQAVAQPFVLDAGTVQVSASIGIALGEGEGMDADRLVHAADAAIYEVKDQGKGGYRLYSER
ncbi:diguanylate cyclase domain-containing protein [Nitrincola alkalilacustris]|uniref:sensor domain-containing diguanylate cyclase n=1 Tax=Nitrincola alkalilacustris TaxID=1571224 RepID=UPI00124E5784|nr:diguanylate cyclase [Nitrincola alkalilacustris]